MAATTNYERIAAWMTHSVFYITDVYSSRYSIYEGDSTGANPTGAFTWSGAAAAVDNRTTSPTRGKKFIGDAMLDIDDAANPDLDVAITNLTRAGGTEMLADFAWSDLTMTNGAFSVASGAQRLSGFFSGPNAVEVGGVFGRYDSSASAYAVRGVFGAKRP